MSQVDSASIPSDCEREPIRVPGSIQPHGVLLTLHPVELIVAQVAGDTQVAFGVSHEDLLGRALGDHPQSALLTSLASQLRSERIAVAPSFVFHLQLPDSLFDVSGHFVDGMLLLEFERRLSTAQPEPMELVQRMASALRITDSLDELLRCMASEVQQATGFDRVMIYRFDPDGHGHVAAEKRSGDRVESFLGLHYPASDIPQQARDLYLKNLIRCIPDVEYASLPVTPGENPLTRNALDLTFSVLRSVSPLHIEYLKHMDVAASMSMSIIVDGKLWGLVACHHLQPKYLDCSLRRALELFAQISSLQLATRLNVEQAHSNVRRRKIQDTLLIDLQSSDLISALNSNAGHLMRLVAAEGLIVRVGQQTFCHGVTPGTAQLDALLRELDKHRPKAVFATDRLSQALPELGARVDATAAGVLAITLSNASEYIIWLLPELAVTVNWAGNPDHAVDLTGDKPAPRKSFASWKESVSGRSRPWEQDEIDAASRLRSALRESAFVLADERVGERNSLQQRQELIMAELDHRVKNILATIQSLVRFSSKSAESLASFTQALEQRLISMARAHDLLTSSRWTGASLHRLIMEELSAYCAPGNSNLQLSGDDISLTPAAALSLSLLLHELATNAVKYGCLSVPQGRLSIQTERIANGAATPLIRVHWIEREGPPVTKPERQGFGRLLLEKVYENDASGAAVALSFEKAGVRCRIDLPADRVVAASGTAPPLLPQGAAHDVARFAGLNVLVLEYDALMALDVSNIVTGAGARIIGPFQFVDDAMRAAAQTDFDVALLEVHVNESTVWPLARLIRTRGLPVVFTTGGAGTTHPAEFRDTVLLRKPYDAQTLLSSLQLALSGNAG